MLSPEKQVLVDSLCAQSNYFKIKLPEIFECCSIKNPPLGGRGLCIDHYAAIHSRSKKYPQLLELFEKKKTRKSRITSRTSEQTAAQSTRSFQLKKFNGKKSHLKKNYGLSLNEHEELLKKSDYVCYICGKVNKSGRALHVDHCHRTNKVRGILCAKCNLLLGMADDSPTILRKAIQYLEEGGSCLSQNENTTTYKPNWSIGVSGLPKNVCVLIEQSTVY